MILDCVKRVLLQEGQALSGLAEHLDSSFQTAVEWMLKCQGRVATCGVGKSGHIARKTAGTLSSTGTPSYFLHAAEALHGDLGMVAAADILILYSNSGETDEMIRALPAIKAIGARTILITARPDSTVGRSVDLALDIHVKDEACPNNLAPTTSTTVMVGLSDALAIAVMEQRGFGKEDFARFHPSGSLGRRLLLTVQEVMRKGADLPLVGPDDDILEVMSVISNAGAGGAIVVGESEKLIGYFSDGDLRRHFVSQQGGLSGCARDLMKSDILTIDPSVLAIDALETFLNFPVKIGELPVVDQGRVVGLVTIKDLLRCGIV